MAMIAESYYALRRTEPAQGAGVCRNSVGPVWRRVWWCPRSHRRD